MLYQANITAAPLDPLDRFSPMQYTNTTTGNTSLTLPNFMSNRLDWGKEGKKATGTKKKKGDKTKKRNSSTGRIEGSLTRSHRSSNATKISKNKDGDEEDEEDEEDEDGNTAGMSFYDLKFQA